MWRRFVLFFGACLAIGATIAPIPAAAETRCGWFVNPTPGNFWLIDPEGEWAIAWQGQEQPPGFEIMPDMSRGGWVETNGHYGYGCGCVAGVVDTVKKKFIRITGGEPQPLAVCRRNKRLPVFE